MNKLKTIFHLFILSFFILTSCNKNEPKLVDESLTELTKLSYLSGITKIDLKGNNENYDVEVFKFSKNRSINIKSKNQELILKTDLNASIKKNKGSNFLIYNFKDKLYNLNNDEVFDKLSEIEKEELIFLITIYNELFDKSIKRYSRLELEEKGIDLKELSENCAKFESAIGFTSTASNIRAVNDALDYIETHPDCHVVGYDTSCATDSHVCITTATMACSTSCNWWN